jgi:hypothetical protein
LAKQPGADDVGKVFQDFQSQGLVPRHDDGRELTASEVVQSALDFDQALRRQPAAVIQALAAAHGVQLVEPSGPQIDPNQIRQQVYAEFAQQQAQQQAQQHAAREAWLQNEIGQFTNGKEYWPQIENEVIAQVALLRSMNPTKADADPLGVLKQAHDRALKQVGIDPDQKTKLAEQKKKADQAKRLASLNVVAPRQREADVTARGGGYNSVRSSASVVGRRQQCRRAWVPAKFREP